MREIKVHELEALVGEEVFTSRRGIRQFSLVGDEVFAIRKGSGRRRKHGRGIGGC